MASLVTRKSGLRFVQFVNHAGEQKTITPKRHRTIVRRDELADQDR